MTCPQRQDPECLVSIAKIVSGKIELVQRVLTGARVTGVDEPAWVGSRALIEIEFDEVAEPKALLPADLLRFVNIYGSYLKAAEVIGASEAFVRQNCFKRGSS